MGELLHEESGANFGKMRAAKTCEDEGIIDGPENNAQQCARMRGGLRGEKWLRESALGELRMISRIVGRFPPNARRGFSIASH